MGIFEIFSLVMSTFGVLSSASDARKKAEADKAAAEYNASIERNNAIVARMQQNDAIQRGDLEVEKHMRKVALLKGTQTASMAARGLDLSEGTPLNVLTDTDYLGEIDKNTIKANAAREAWGYQTQALNYDSRANLYSMTASNINPSRAYNSTLLSGLGSVASKWYTMSGGGTTKGGDAEYRARLNEAAYNFGGGWD